MFNKRVILSIVTAITFALLISKYIDIKNNDLLYKHTFISKTHTNKKYKIIIAGDSRVYRGISPEQIQKILKHSALNLGYSSAGFEKTLFNLINNKLDTTSYTKIIILGITPWSLTPEASKNEHLKQELNRKREEIISDKYFFKIKKSFTVLSPRLISKKYIKKSNILYNYQEEFYPNGWIASWYIVPQPYKALPEYKKTFKKNTVSKKIILNLLNQIKKWTNNKIKVYGFFPPSSFDMEVLEDNYSGLNRKKFVADFINAGGNWLNVGKDYTSYDGSHLEKKSAIKLSNKIAKLILNHKTTNYYTDNKTEYLCKNIKHKILVNLSSQVLHNKIKKQNTTNIVCVNNKNIYGSLLIKQISQLKILPKKICITSNILLNDTLSNPKLIFNIERDSILILQKTLNLSDICKNNKWTKVEFSIFVPKKIKLSDYIKIYFFNKSKTPIYIKNAEINIL